MLFFRTCLQNGYIPFQEKYISSTIYFLSFRNGFPCKDRLYFFGSCTTTFEIQIVSPTYLSSGEKPLQRHNIERPKKFVFNVGVNIPLKKQRKDWLEDFIASKERSHTSQWPLIPPRVLRWWWKESVFTQVEEDCLHVSLSLSNFNHLWGVVWRAC